MTGAEGQRGKDAQFRINVQTSSITTSYDSLYDMSLLSNAYVDTNGYNVVEPGSTVLLWDVHKNVGGMPTPVSQRIWSSVKVIFYFFRHPKIIS